MKTPVIPSKMTYQVINEWQLCPKCEGSGNMYDRTIVKDSEPLKCNLCNGKMVISKCNGLPTSDDYKGPIILSYDDSIKPEKRNKIWNDMF
jgi:hypothetical protein